MNDTFQSILVRLFHSCYENDNRCLFDPVSHFESETTSDAGIARRLNAAFLIALAGPLHPYYTRARVSLDEMTTHTRWGSVARFYCTGIDRVHGEIDAVSQQDAGFADKVRSLASWMALDGNIGDGDSLAERLWTVFCPEAAGVWGRGNGKIARLRAKRTVTVTERNESPVVPARELLFTSNVLLTPPSSSTDIEKLSLSADVRKELSRVMQEPQVFWYDHPVHIGVAPEKNEILHGLRGLDETVAYERLRGNVADGERCVCALSLSVTHRGLHTVAKKYVEEELAATGGFHNLRVHVFCESDAEAIIEEVLLPAARHYMNRHDADGLLSVFGVDGEYGRHYSFLKALAAFWHTLIDRRLKATFKIDLDQVFPNEELVAETERSAFEHLATPLWGATGVDAAGKPVTLGMIAGALVNHDDIYHSLFTPDVTFPDRALSFDEHIFFSAVPQALSTEAEMMEKYDAAPFDGMRTVLQRIHVTGGTTGIRVDSLIRFRPFTPSFIGRAEDQAYILSTMLKGMEALGYVHESGLIMRHDKDAFAQEAIVSAATGKLIGDYLRILYFSAYAQVIDDDAGTVKDRVDPFTGCFVSKIPLSVVYLRFALRAAAFFEEQKDQDGIAFIETGVPRIADAVTRTTGNPCPLETQYHGERRGWDLYYDILDVLAAALARRDDVAVTLKKKAEAVVERCAVRIPSGDTE